METLSVPLGDRTYPIHIGSGLLSNLGQILRSINFPSQVAVVTNPTVASLYADAVKQQLAASGFSSCLLVVPDGEAYKNLEVLNTIYDGLIEQRFDRGCGLLALGGGVVGDMAGFAAATFVRGIPYVQLPTTLLSQVDSSVGGKTAVNHARGKNLIGAFYQPQLVIIDTDTLNTLDLREVQGGLAEVVKYGMIRDADFFAWLEQNVSSLLNREPEALAHAIRTACQIKADIVEIDEREGSVRAYLNFGHTFGHAIENLAGYGRIKHGEAVAVGMVVAARISHNQGLCSAEDVLRLTNLLRAFGLPVSAPDFPLDDYVAAMWRDKKVQGGALTLVLNEGIGRVVLKKTDQVRELFSAALS